MTIANFELPQDLASLLVTVPSEPRDLGTLRDASVELLKRYLAAAGEQRTPILRQLAVNLVESRQHFGRADGSPDWTGRTWQYRQFVREIYDAAGIDKQELNTIQSKTRYHIGSTLREFLDEETLQEYGLGLESPRDKSKERRTVRSTQYNAFTARDVGGGALMGVTAALTVLARIDAEEIVNLDPVSRDAVRAAAEGIETKVSEILRLL